MAKREHQEKGSYNLKNIIWKFCAQHEQYIQTAASILTDQIIKKPNSLFTLATGQSPKDVYTRWVQEIKEQKINTEQMIIHKLVVRPISYDRRIGNMTF